MRPLIKTCTYSAMHFVVAFSVAYWLTGSWQSAAAIGMLEPLVQTVAYAIHEKVWARMPQRLAPPWGKIAAPEGCM